MARWFSLLFLSILNAHVSSAITDFSTCDGDLRNLFCYNGTDCVPNHKCAADAAGNAPASGMPGCCVPRTVDFATCDGDASLGCFDDTDCKQLLGGARCDADAAGSPPAAGSMGCCTPRFPYAI